MIEETRIAYNAAFTQEAYQKMVSELEQKLGRKIEFRIAETPVFFPEAFLKKLVAAGDELVKIIQSKDFKGLTENAIPAKWFVQNETDHPHFLTFDFAVTRDDDGELTPKLIELQGFPSLYGFQSELGEQFRKHFPVIQNLKPYFAHTDQDSYFELLRKTIVGNQDPKEIILLDINAEQQKTAIDFYLTAEKLGITIVSLHELKQHGKDIFYSRNGFDFPVKTIYNRLIFDEITNKEDAFKNVPDLLSTDRVKWLTHPNWFYRISKYTMPFLVSESVPKTYFVSELPNIPMDLENYVLKPLFSFAGQGVIIDVKESDILAIDEPQNWILQEKVTYEPVIQSPDGMVKCEIRLMYLWPEGQAKPTLVMNLVRLSRGKMIGVDFNRNFDWVGGSVGLF